MKTVLFSLMVLLGVTACVSSNPYYEVNNYRRQDVTKMTFPQSRAECRAQHLKRDKTWGTHQLDQYAYMDCMYKNGWRFSQS